MLMAADVSSVVQMMSRYKEKEGEGKRRDLVTMDLLGGSGRGGDVGADGGGVLGSKELDLDLKVPTGWEKRLDLLSGEVFFQRRNNNNNSRSDSDHQFTQDRNFTPTFSSIFHPPPPNLDLKLFPPSSSSVYQSVCTLDKVKFALQQVSKKKQNTNSQSPTSSSTTTSSIRQKQGRERVVNDEDCESKSLPGEDGGTGMLAAGCPSCLSYVLVSKGNLRCPRCQLSVPLPVAKKPRIDLNSAKASLHLF